MKYRTEVDGLRAVAVLPVIFFHAGSTLVSGGFIGVDIFFVISGYLITSIIINELQNEKFTLLGFYERRARRILPALFLVMLACIPFAWLWMLPGELKSFSKSLIAVSLYVSNMLFWTESGYFNSSAELKPLLHTWSLAVEEQFYLLYPLFLSTVWRFGKNRIIVMLCILGVLSLALAQLGSVYKPIANFLFFPPRGFELIIGALVAFNRHEWADNAQGKVHRQFLNQGMSLLGAGLIFYALFAFTRTTPFPGFYALIPTLGTAFILNYADRQTLVGRFLSLPLLVGIGLISYSAYLWHQPLFAFFRLRSFDEPGPEIFLLLSLATLLLAYCSWKYVEGPFRNKRKVDRKSIFIISGAMTVFMIGIGLAGFYSESFDQRTFADGTTYKQFDYRMRSNYGLNPACDGKTTFALECRNSDQPEIAVWGDSFGMHLIPGILASNPKAKLIQMTWSFCGPFHEFAPFNGSEYNYNWAQKCIDHNRKVLEIIEKTPSIKYVVLASPFVQYVSDEWKFLTRNGPVEFNRGAVLKALVDTLQLLKNKGLRPVVFSPPPSIDYEAGHCITVSQFFKRNFNQCDIDLSLPHPKLTKAMGLLSEIGKQFKFVRLDEVLCEHNKCSAFYDNNIIYIDTHLSYEGSAYLGKKLNFYRQITTL